MPSLRSVSPGAARQASAAPGAAACCACRWQVRVSVRAAWVARRRVRVVLPRDVEVASPMVALSQGEVASRRVEAQSRDAPESWLVAAALRMPASRVVAQQVWPQVPGAEPVRAWPRSAWRAPMPRLPASSAQQVLLAKSPQARDAAAWPGPVSSRRVLMAWAAQRQVRVVLPWAVASPVVALSRDAAAAGCQLSLPARQVPALLRLVPAPARARVSSRHALPAVARYRPARPVLPSAWSWSCAAHVHAVLVAAHRWLHPRQRCAVAPARASPALRRRRPSPRMSSPASPPACAAAAVAIQGTRSCRAV